MGYLLLFYLANFGRSLGSSWLPHELSSAWLVAAPLCLPCFGPWMMQRDVLCFLSFLLQSAVKASDLKGLSPSFQAGRQVNGIYKGREIREQSGEFSFTASWGWGETNSSSQFFGNSHRESQGWREPQSSYSPTLCCASIRPLALRSRSFMPWSFPVQTTTWGCCLKNQAPLVGVELKTCSLNLGEKTVYKWQTMSKIL